MALPIVLGNIYHDAVNARLTELTPKYAQGRTFYWYYRKTGTTAWTFVPGSKSSLPAYSTAVVSPWCIVPRGTMLPNTSYDLKCVIDYSGSTATAYEYKTIKTNAYIFKLVKVGSVATKFRFDPQLSIPNGTKLFFYRAPDELVRVNKTAAVWEAMGSRVWNVSQADTEQLIFQTPIAYTNYDYKVIFVNSSDVVTNIVFIED